MLLVTGGRPLLSADYGFGFPHLPYTNGTTNVGWHVWPSQDAAGAAYRAEVLAAANTSFIIGWNKCEYIDRVVGHRGIALHLKPGVFDFDASPHEPFATHVAAANTDALSLARDRLTPPAPTPPTPPAPPVMSVYYRIFVVLVVRSSDQRLQFKPKPISMYDFVCLCLAAANPHLH